MSANDVKLDASVRDKMLRDAAILTKTVRESAGARQEIMEAAQFERGYN